MSKSIVGARSAGVHHAPITPAQHHFSTPGNHCRLLTQQCYYYTFPGTAVQEGRPSHPLRHFLQKTACFHVQDGGLPSSAPSGGSDFASGNRGIILGAVAQGFNRMGLFFKAVVLAAGANVLFNHLKVPSGMIWQASLPSYFFSRASAACRWLHSCSKCCSQIFLICRSVSSSTQDQ